MIEVTIRSDRIQMSGHAQRKSADGIDRVCAAISALTCNLINSLTDLSEDCIQVEIESGMTMIQWESLSDKGKLLVASWYLGLTEINKEYGCIEFQ